MNLLQGIERDDYVTGRKIKNILIAFGVDCYGRSSLRGEGCYKEVHRTNIPGVALFLTKAKRQFDREVLVLELLNEYGFPAMKYYSIENIDGVVVALGKMLKPHESRWDTARTQAVHDQVEGWLLAMIDEGVYLEDLQFMLDDDDQPVFIDPLDMCDVRLDYRGTYRQSAMCKDDKSCLSVLATKYYSEENR